MEVNGIIFTRRILLIKVMITDTFISKTLILNYNFINWISNMVVETVIVIFIIHQT